MGNDGGRLHHCHGPLHLDLEFFDESGWNPSCRYPHESQGSFQCQLANWISGLVYCMELRVQSCLHHTGLAFPFWGHPGAAVGQTVSSIVLAYVFWQGSLAVGLSPTFSFAAVASSIIFWSLVYSWHLQFWGVTKYTFFKRSILAFIIECIIVMVWLIISKVILGPVAEKIAAAKLPADVNILIIYLNLCIVGPALILHNAFWLRWPLTIPTPPGTPPPDQAA